MQALQIPSQEDLQGGNEGVVLYAEGNGEECGLQVKGEGGVLTKLGSLLEMLVVKLDQYHVITETPVKGVHIDSLVNYAV